MNSGPGCERRSFDVFEVATAASTMAMAGHAFEGARNSRFGDRQEREAEKERSEARSPEDENRSRV